MVWFDRPWLGEGSTDIHNFFAGSLIKIKAFEFAESFSKTGKIATGWLSKVAGAVLPPFQKRIVHQQPICRTSVIQ